MNSESGQSRVARLIESCWTKSRITMVAVVSEFLRETFLQYSRVGSTATYVHNAHGGRTQQIRRWSDYIHALRAGPVQVDQTQVGLDYFAERYLPYTSMARHIWCVPITSVRGAR